MPPPVAGTVADGQVFEVTAASLTLRSDMFQGGIFRSYVLPADPAWHLTMQLPGHGVVDLGAGQGKSAHEGAFSGQMFSGGRLDLPACIAPPVIRAKPHIALEILADAQQQQ